MIAVLRIFHLTGRNNLLPFLPSSNLAFPVLEVVKIINSKHLAVMAFCSLNNFIKRGISSTKSIAWRLFSCSESLGRSLIIYGIYFDIAFKFVPNESFIDDLSNFLLTVISNRYKCQNALSAYFFIITLYPFQAYLGTPAHTWNLSFVTAERFRS